MQHIKIRSTLAYRGIGKVAVSVIEVEACITTFQFRGFGFWPIVLYITFYVLIVDVLFIKKIELWWIVIQN